MAEESVPKRRASHHLEGTIPGLAARDAMAGAARGRQVVRGEAEPVTFTPEADDATSDTSSDT